VKEELLIVGLGIAGTIADYATTKIGLRLELPEIKPSEINPLVNPVFEGAFAVAGPLLISGVGKRLGASPTLTLALMIVPASIPWIVATRNLIIIGTVNAGKYPINEFPLIYWR
jgi:hypothetical protein